MDSYTEELEHRLDLIEADCKSFADEIITTVCKRAIRKMNKKLDIVFGCGDYPKHFRFFDCLSIELQSKSYCDISPLLEDTVEDMLWNEYDKLSPKEKFFVSNKECSLKDWLDDSKILTLLRDCFHEMLNEHWQLKKIQNFEERRTW